MELQAALAVQQIHQNRHGTIDLIGLLEKCSPAELPFVIDKLYVYTVWKCDYEDLVEMLGFTVTLRDPDRRPIGESLLGTPQQAVSRCDRQISIATEFANIRFDTCGEHVFEIVYGGTVVQSLSLLMEPELL